MNRRTYLAATTGVVAALAGCSGSTDDSTAEPTESTATTEQNGDVSAGGSAPFKHPGTMETSFAANGDYPADENPADGYPPAMPQDPPEPDVDPSTFETLSVNGQTVRLAPINVVQAWYHRGDARFVDARGTPQYTKAHVYGGVLSSAQTGSEGGGIEGWPLDDRVVTYCGCPHHLSSIRAAGLQKAGFENVFALDEGFFEWLERDLPMGGTRFGQNSQASISEWEITGRLDDRYAGEYVWASAARQYEAAPVREDGSYRLHLKFSGIDAETPVEVRTPTRTIERPLGAIGARV